MLFNSLHFLLFFPVVVSIFYLLPKKYRPLVLVISSYYFYMAWRPEFALLILFSTCIDFFVGKKIEASPSKINKGLYLYFSLICNFGLLFYFKYFNFMINSINSLFEKSSHFEVMNIILPVGISFYTFQTLSYTIDVYRGKQRAEKNFLTFSLYVSFFPQLVAGPIERSTNLLPQLKKMDDPTKEKVIEGAKQIIWGFFKKLVIADKLAIYVDAIYNNVENANSISLILATYMFSFQIFCDFSGYTDIARGCARIFGIDLMENFRRPYFAKSISDFWSRWHISLSTWFRDYLYIPLGGNKVTHIKWVRNIGIVFVISGLWHGANWTFVVWGTIHAFYFLGEKFIQTFLPSLKKENKIKNIVSIVFIYHLVLVAWVVFRAKNINDAFLIFKKIIIDFSINSSAIAQAILPFHPNYDNRAISFFLVSCSVILLMEFFHYIQEQDIHQKWKDSHFKQYGFYIFLILLTIFLGNFNDTSFIYFQF